MITRNESDIKRLTRTTLTYTSLILIYISLYPLEREPLSHLTFNIDSIQPKI